MGILDRIKDIELEMSRTQKNKATTTHLGLLKSQLARLRTELMMPAVGGSNATGTGFDVQRNGVSNFFLFLEKKKQKKHFLTSTL